MENGREKLIQLLDEAHDEYYKICDFSKGYMDVLADHLLANGVTFATDTNDGCKWISVEKPPTKAMKCIVYQTGHIGMNGYLDMASFTPCYDGFPDDPMNGKQVWYKYDGEYGDFEISDVTHWMPMPKPPLDTTNQAADL